MATRRKPQLKAGKTGGFENVDATSTFDLLQQNEDGTSDRTWMQRLLGLTGKYATPTWQEVVQAGVMEIFGTAMLGALVVLARWYNVGSLVIAIAYFIGLWAASHLNGSHSLRRHLNGPITLAYFFTGDIGLLGIVFYKVCQTLGSLIAGAVLSAMLGGVYAGKLTVPLPTTTESSLTMAVCLEIFVTALVILYALLVEFLNTNEAMREKNYRKARKGFSYVMAVIVLVSFQFNAWTFNDNVYLTGLFAGFQKTDPLLGVEKMAQLNPADYAGSVFTSGGAWALYYFGNWAGGVAAGLVFWAFFYLFARETGSPLPNRMNGYKSPVPFGSEAASTAPIDTHLDQLINPLLKK